MKLARFSTAALFLLLLTLPGLAQQAPPVSAPASPPAASPPVATPPPAAVGPIHSEPGSIVVAGLKFSYPIEVAIEKGAIRFLAEKPVGSFTGETSSVRGSLFKKSHGAPPSGRIIIDAASLDTGIEMRNETMREDHLQTQKYPEISFDLRDVTPLEGNKYKVIGDLTLHGVKKPIEITTSAVAEDGKLAVRGAVKLNMTDYGIEPPVLAMIWKVADEVKISFELVFKQVKPPAPTN